MLWAEDSVIMKELSSTRTRFVGTCQHLVNPLVNASVIFIGIGLFVEFTIEGVLVGPTVVGNHIWLCW